MEKNDPTVRQLNELAGQTVLVIWLRFCSKYSTNINFSFRSVPGLFSPKPVMLIIGHLTYKVSSILKC